MKKYVVLTAALSIVLYLTVQAQVYFPDASFKMGTLRRNNANVASIYVQPNNNIMVTGTFFYTNEGAALSPVRLTENGVVDPSYVPFINYGPGVVRPDGKILIPDVYFNAQYNSSLKFTLLNTDGNADSTFLTDIMSSELSKLNAIAVQQNNKIVVGTIYRDFSGDYLGSLSRLNSDGTTDNTFNTGALQFKWINAVAVQPDGKILVSGDFILPNSTELYFVRLNPDGSLDNTFTMGYNYANVIVVQASGKILVGTNALLIRLNSDGQQDLTFAVTNSVTTSLAVQSDGKIVAGLWFQDNVNYLAGYGKIIRVNDDGTNDNTFVSGSGPIDYPLNTLAITSSGAILAGGGFNQYDDQQVYGLVRLTPTGTFDPTFHPKLETSGFINQTVRQPNGKLIIVGQFTTLDDTPLGDVMRLNSDGSKDATFDAGTGVDGFWDLDKVGIRKIVLQSDKRILLAGYFNSFDGKPTVGMLRLNENGSRDETFNYTESGQYNFTALALQGDGKIIVGAVEANANSILFKRINSAGTADATLATGTGFNGSIQQIVVQSNGKIIVVGSFLSYNGATVDNVMRINADGSLDNTFITHATGAEKIYLQADGKVIAIGHSVVINDGTAQPIVRLNADGSLDTSFNFPKLPYAEINDVIIRADNTMLLTGYLTNTGIVEINNDGSINNAFAISDLINYYFFSTIPADEKLIVSLGNTLVQFLPPVVVPPVPVVAGIENSEQQIHLYPNPTSDILTIDLPVDERSSTIHILDARGASVTVPIHASPSGFQAEIRSLSRGLYLVQILGVDKKYVKKFLVEK